MPKLGNTWAVRQELARAVTSQEPRVECPRVEVLAAGGCDAFGSPRRQRRQTDPADPD